MIGNAGAVRDANRLRHVSFGMLLLLIAVGCNSELGAGPLEPPEPVPRSGGGFVLPVGRSLTVTDVYLHNYGPRPAMLDRVELIGATEGIELLGALVALNDGPYWISGDEAFPPSFPIDMHPLEGFVIPPHEALGSRGVVVFLGLRQRRVGVDYFQAVAIHYHVGSRRYRYVYPYAVQICTPVKRYASGENDCIPFLYGETPTTGASRSPA